MANNEEARAEVILNGQQANKTLKELENAARALNAELRKMPTNSAEFTKKAADYQALKKQISAVKQEINGVQDAMGKFADWANKYFQSLTMAAASIVAVALSIKNLVANAGELSDSLANIRKTTGMTAAEVNKLNNELKKIDTRTSVEELRQIAGVAGQLGIEKEQVYAFTESIDKLNVALGDEIQGGAEGVATTMGTLRNVLTDMKTKDVSDDLLRIGNAINDLSAAGFATAPVLSDFANRIGGVGINLGLTSEEVLGISATMQELAISTERGGTAMVKILSKMTTNTGEFAKVAGLPLEEFTALVNRDLYGAFTKVLEGSKRAGEGATILGGMIKEMEIQGVGAAEVFSKFGSNTDMLAQKVTLAGKSLLTTAGIEEEFNIKNTTLGASLDKLGKDFSNLMSASFLIDILKSGVGVVIDLVKWLKDLPQTIRNNAVTFTLLTGAMLVWVSTMTKGIQASILNNLLMKEGILVKIKDAIVTEVRAAKESLLNLAKERGTKATNLATIAQWLWNAAMSANPIGLVIAGVTALVAIIVAYTKYNAEAVSLDKQKGALTALLAGANNKLEDSYSKISDQIRKLNKLSIEEKKDLQEKINLKLKEAEAELLVLEAKQQSIGKQEAKPTLWQKATSFQWTPQGQAKSDQYYAWKNQQEAMQPFDEGIKGLQDKINGFKNLKQSIDDVVNAESNADKIILKTSNALDEKLSLYRTAAKDYVAGSEARLRIEKKIAETEKELAKYDKSDQTSPAAKKKAEAEALKTAYEKLNVKIKEYTDLLKEQVQTDPQKAAETAKLIAGFEKEKKAIDDLVKSMIDQASFDNNAPVGRMAPSNGITGSSKSSIYGKDEGQMDITSGIQQPGSLDGGEDGQTGLQDWAGKANAALKYGDDVMTALNSVDEIMSNKENAQLARDEAANAQKEKNLKKRLNSGLINQKQYDAAVAKMDEDLAKKRRKIEHDQAVRAKAMAVVQAGINIAQGITAALTGTPPASYAMAIITGVLGAIQLAAILSAEVPQAAKGRYNVTGRDDGRLYSNVPWVGSASTGLYASPTLISEAGPEYVIDAKTTRNLQMNYPGVIDAINFARVPQFAAGNYPQAAGSSGTVVQQNQMMFQDGLLSAINEFNNHARNGIRTFVVYDDVRDSANTINEIETSVKTS